MKVKFLGKVPGLKDPTTGEIYRVMFHNEAKNKFNMLWEDDSVVRIVMQENPYKGTFAKYPFTEDWEINEI